MCIYAYIMYIYIYIHIYIHTHVRVLPSFQQQMFQTFTTLGLDIQMPGVSETCSYGLFQVNLWNVGC